MVEWRQVPGRGRATRMALNSKKKSPGRGQSKKSVRRVRRGRQDADTELFGGSRNGREGIKQLGDA